MTTATQRLADLLREPAFFARIAAAALKIGQARDGAEVSAALDEARALFSADAAAFASFMRDDEAYESYRFILACDPTWCLEYESAASYMHDPWLAYVRHQSEAVLTSQVPVRSAPAAEVVALARRYGFASAVLLPAHAPQGLTRLGALVLGSASPGYFDEETLPTVAVAATGLAQSLHTWQVSKLREEMLDRVRLSAEELTLLEYARQGLSSKEVGRLKQVTAQSVDSRWQRLNNKLGVSSRANAARLAAEYGLV
jgi:DNA-binding CsgD family transcriptional regulator